MILPDKVAGLDPRIVRDMFKAFADAETKYEFNDGLPKVIPRRMTADHILKSLQLSQTDAERVHSILIADGWIEKDRLCPTHKGMALAQHVDRPRISGADANDLVCRVLDWADGVNADVNARVKVKTIDLYGSVARGEQEVGDVDIIVKFTTFDLGDDLQPDDSVREDELIVELSSISEYISPASEIDQMCMPNADYRTIFPRPT